MTILRLTLLWLDLLKWINENDNEDDQNMEKATRLSCRLMHRTPQSAYHVARYHHPPLWATRLENIILYPSITPIQQTGSASWNVDIFPLINVSKVKSTAHCAPPPPLSLTGVWQQWLASCQESVFTKSVAMCCHGAIFCAHVWWWDQPHCLIYFPIAKPV